MSDELNGSACGRCGHNSVSACDEIGCGFLGAGNGQDERDAAIAQQAALIAELEQQRGGVNERAVFEVWANSAGCGNKFRESMFMAWQARARLNPCRAQAVPDGWREVIQKTLRNYRMGTLSDGEGGGYPLIDAMSADGQTVAGGIEECEYLAEAIWCALNEAAAPSANSEQARSCVTCNGVGIIGHSTLCPECAAAPSANKESGDE